MKRTSSDYHSRPYLKMENTSMKLRVLVLHRQLTILMLTLTILLVSFLSGAVFGQGAITASWPLVTASGLNGSAAGTGSTNISVGAASLGTQIGNEGHNSSGVRMGSLSTNWPNGIGAATNHYINFPIEANASYKLTISTSDAMSLQIAVTGGSGQIFGQIQYSINGGAFTNFGTSFNLPSGSGSFTSISKTPVSKIEVNGTESINFRLFLYTSSTVTNGRDVYLRNVSVSGTTSSTGVFTLPSVSTNSVTGITTSAANSGGNATSDGGDAISAKGVVYSTSPNPSIGGGGVVNLPGGVGTGSFVSNLSGLNASTTYYIRAYATNSVGTAYGAELPFMTSEISAPTVTTTAINLITTNTASSGGNATNDGGSGITAKGVVYSTSTNPMVGGGGVVNFSGGIGTGPFTSNLTGLNPATTYYLKAYATNGVGTSYGSELSFTTKANYRSKQSGDWNQISTWQIYNGSMWIDASVIPTSADGTIEIVNGHTVTVGATVTADQVTVNGILKVSVSGASFPGIIVNGTYQHDINDKAIPDAIWNSGSELLITGLTSSGDLSNMDQSFANITIDCPGYNVLIGTSTTVIITHDNFMMKAGSKMWIKNIGNGGNMTITRQNVTTSISILQIDDDFIAINRNAGGDRTVNVGELVMNGGTLYVNWGNGNTNDGILNISGNVSMSSGAKIAQFRNGGSEPPAFVNLTGTSKNLQFGQVSGIINFTVSSGPADLLSDWSIPAGSLTISSNKINTSSNILSIGSAVSFSRTTGYINGNFGKGIGSGTTSKTFEIGDATNYTPVNISFSGTTNGSGSLVASTTATDHPDLSNSGINASKSVNRYFSVENNGVSGFSSFNITMNYAAADVDAGATAASFKVRKYSTANIPSWIAPASVSVGSNSITATGFNSFSDFAIGEVAIPTTTSIMNVTATYGDGVVTLTAGIIPPDATGLIHFFVDCLEVGTGMNAGGTATFDLDPSALTVGNHVIRAEYYTDGTYESSVSENGELTIHPKQLTVTIAANDKEYDGTTNAVVSVGSVIGIIGSEDVSVVASNGQFIDKNVGNGKEVSASLALAGADKDNYTIDLSAITTANISAKAVTISIAADNKPYDGNTSATVTALYPVTGVVAGDDVIASASNGQFASADAGNGIAVSADVAAAGDDAGNYTFNNTASTTADITKADATIVVNGYTGMYDGNEHGASLVSAVGVNNEDLAASVDLGSKYKNVGVENAGWTFSNKNYNAQADAVEIEITPAELIVTVNNASKLCGQADPVFTGMITGAVGLEVFTATYTAVGTAIAAAINENTDNYDVVIYEGLLSITGVSIDASASSNPVKLGDIAKLSATVSPVAANVKVSFYLNDVLQCAVMTNASGIATKDITGLAVGVYKVKAIVGDDCVESIAYLPVYDPSGGFVTGGGWILSPAGAYVADAALTGKANFGFNAKYKKGSNAVDGNTEFQFQAGNLNFKSTENTAGTLVIAGAKANFKGKGSINGVAGYSFMVSGIDGDINGGGGTDKFRIKIWNTASSELVYDNNLGFDENSVPTTCLGGGSIVIHEVKAGGKTSQKVDPDLLVTSLDARVFNNPAAGASTFRLKVLSPDADQKISLRIVDMSGKSLDQMQGLSAGQTVEFGAMYKTGMYVAEILQNGQRKLVKLVKQ